MELYDYQNQCLDRTHEAYRQGCNAPLLVMPTGAGKTMTFACATRKASERGKRVLLMAHRRELVGQISEALTRWDVPHGMITPAHKPTNHAVQVAMAQTLARRIPLDRTGLFRFDLVVVDECFPSGTMIDNKPIESLKVGDEVYSFNHQSQAIEKKTILRLFKSPLTYLVCVKIENGTQVFCTPNHPFFVVNKNAYVAAQSLTVGDELLVYENMQYMQEGIYPETPQHKNASLLFKGVFNDWQDYQTKRKITATAKSSIGKGNKADCWTVRSLRETSNRILQAKKIITRVLFRCLQGCLREIGKFAHDVNHQFKICGGSHVGKKPDENRCTKDEGFGIFTRIGSPSTNTRGEWKGYSCSSKDAGLPIGVGYGSCDTDENAKGIRVSALLQTEHSECGLKDRDRSGWKFKPFNSWKAKSREKTGVLRKLRVDSIEVQQPGRVEGCETMQKDGYVYNIEVADNHNYFANGILVHNCHHATPDSTWGAIIQHNAGAKLLGVTATPCRLDGKGLGVAAGGFFDAMVIGPTVEDLIARGRLAPPVVYAPEFGADLSGIKKRGGDYDRKGLAAAMEDAKLTGDAVAHYRQLCDGMPSIAFTVDTKHAAMVADEFKAAGYAAAVLTGSTPDKERADMIKDLGAGRLNVLASCNVISEGTDIPSVMAAILLRPTMSFALAMQQMGRALRALPGKDKAIILDHAGNTHKHGLPTEPVEWSLEGATRKQYKQRKCFGCGGLLGIGVKVCPGCGKDVGGKGEDLPDKEQEDAFPLVKEGKLIEFTPELRKQMHDWRRRQQQKAKSLEDFQMIGEKMGYHPKWAEYRFRELERS